jgi:hypothetical protein
MSETELVRQESSDLAERTVTPNDLRRALELRAAWAAQDDAALLGALRERSLASAEQSVRLCPTGRADSDGSPIFNSVGPEDSPDAVLAPMVGRSFTIHHTAVRGPVLNTLPSREAPALPPPEPSHSSNEETREK